MKKKLTFVIGSFSVLTLVLATIAPKTGFAVDLAELQQELSSVRMVIEESKKFRDEIYSYLDDPKTHNAGSSPDSFQPCSGRLTLQTGVPVTTVDQVAKSELYFTPYQGTKIEIYSGSFWQMYTLSEISLALSGLTAGSNYDVFVYWISPSFYLELSNPWTNATTRNDALALQDGVYVKSTNTTRRYVGTIQATGATTTEDSSANRLVWNFYNRSPRPVSVVSAVSNWASGGTGDVWRAADNNTANSVKFIVGDSDAIVFLHTQGLSLDNGLAQTSIGIDSSTVSSGLAYGVNGTNQTTAFDQTPGFYFGQPGLGSHTAYWLEAWDTTSATWYGTNGNSAQIQAGMFGWVAG
jgi:hypothetical protein